MDKKTSLDDIAGGNIREIANRITPETAPEDAKAIVKEMVRGIGELEKKMDESLEREFYKPKWMIRLAKGVARYKANKSLQKGDKYANLNLVREACDEYLTAMFLYDFLGEDAKAQAVKAKFYSADGSSYYPNHRKNWNSICYRTFDLIFDISSDYDPEQRAMKFFDKSHPAYEAIVNSACEYMQPIHMRKMVGRMAIERMAETDKKKQDTLK
jgi:hypothetical protein